MWLASSLLLLLLLPPLKPLPRASPLFIVVEPREAAKEQKITASEFKSMNRLLWQFCLCQECNWKVTLKTTTKTITIATIHDITPPASNWAARVVENGGSSSGSSTSWQRWRCDHMSEWGAFLSANLLADRRNVLHCAWLLVCYCCYCGCCCCCVLLWALRKHYCQGKLVSICTKMRFFILSISIFGVRQDKYTHKHTHDHTSQVTVEIFEEILRKITGTINW